MTEATQESLLVAIETSGDMCGVAVLRDGVLAVEQTFRHHMHLSEGLLDTVQTVLKSAGASLADVNGLAVGIGPGSFTGTRIGVMTAKTLAAVRGIPLYGIIGLEALAWAYRGLQGVSVVPILPCRTDVVFTASYDVTSEKPVVGIVPDALALEALAEQLIAAGSPHVLLCGAAVPRYGETLRSLLAGHGISIRQTTTSVFPRFEQVQDTEPVVCPVLTVSLGEERMPRASMIGALAYQRVAAGLPSDPPFDLVPLYISPPPITMPKIPIPQNKDIGEG